MGRSRETYIPSDQNIISNKKEKVNTHSQPVDNVRIGRVAGATSVLLITTTVDQNWVLQGS